MLTEEEKLRYSRQILIPEIGQEGQERLSQACVMIAGLGGLGSITAYYLATAGVKHLIIIDYDVIKLDNLNRQLLYNTKDIGRLKVESACEKLQDLNPNCRIDPILTDITVDKDLDPINACQLIIDATDNLKARQELNRISQVKKIPFIYGGIDGLNGMTTTFIPGKTGCLSCVFPHEKGFRNQGAIGALGPVAGIIASIQCIEAVKILIGMEPRLTGKLLRFKGAELSFQEIILEKNPECIVCGS